MAKCQSKNSTCQMSNARRIDKHSLKVWVWKEDWVLSIGLEDCLIKQNQQTKPYLISKPINHTFKD